MAATSVALGIPGELLRRRPDIRAAERAVAGASAEIGVAAADLYPHFEINGGFGWTANNPSDLFTSEAFGGIIGPSFRWDILNFGRIRSNVVRQEARFQEAAIRYQQTVLNANKEVENALVEFLEVPRANRTASGSRHGDQAIRRTRTGAIQRGSHRFRTRLQPAKCSRPPRRSIWQNQKPPSAFHSSRSTALCEVAGKFESTDVPDGWS